MGTVRVAGFAVSIDGFGAGPDQSLEHPLGKGGPELHNWFYPTRAFRSMIGQEGGTDDRFARAAAEGFGAFILGRNMFGPAGDDWGGPNWKGWWGDNPPYHAPTFILTHHARAPIVMEGGTTFHFVTDGIESALEQAREAAGGQDVLLLGGASVAQQYLAAGLVDEMLISVVPLFLRGGSRLFEGLGEGDIKLEQLRAIDAPGVTHITYRVG